jgi:hypothetical protein
MWTPDRVLQTISAAERLPGDFSQKLIARLRQLLADYDGSNNWLANYCGSRVDAKATYALFRLNWFHRHLLQKEMDALCREFLQWSDCRAQFNLFPEADETDTRQTIALLEFHLAKPH